MDIDRSRILERYCMSRCDVCERGGWRPWRSVPDRDLIAVSAWNPFDQQLPTTANAERDRKLLRYLKAKGHLPLRIRGRSDGGAAEEGWMIPHVHDHSLALIRRFEQHAGLIVGPRGRAVLWSDGSIDPIDNDGCAVPAAPPAAVPAALDGVQEGP